MYSFGTKLSDIKGVGMRFLSRLERLGVKTVEDLLRHFPVRYEDFSEVTKIKDLEINKPVTIHGVVQSVDVRRSWKRRRMTIIEALIRDDTGTVRATWFNQPYIARILQPGVVANFSGKLTQYKNELHLSSPAYEIVRGSEPELKHTAGLIPVYPETKNLTSRGIRYIVYSILEDLEKLEDWMPEEILELYDFPEINTAFHSIHFPENLNESKQAKKRFAFEGIFLIQLLNFKLRQALEERRGFLMKISSQELENAVAKLPFSLTASQMRSLSEIIEDLGRGAPMNRLLQGDVGSGKTVIAALAAFFTAKNGHQSVFLAPTEVLALQHYRTLLKIFKDEPVSIGLVTRSYKKFADESMEQELSKTEMARKIFEGKVKIVIGTHAVIQKDIHFHELGLIVVDEQHRFGVRQRAELMGRSVYTPHFLSMSATPIPRTLALTFFGDLDLSIIDELPKGRKPIITKIVAPENRDKAYAFIRGEVKKGRQVFVICPRIERIAPTDGWKPKTSWDDVKAVKEEYEKLSKKVFPDLRVAMLHGKLKSEEKKKIMEDFEDRKSDVLISTSVVEVGVDVPNASIMMIDGADRFGLAQLYQFRGRVGRGEHQSFCLLFSESDSESVNHRLHALIDAKNGFELAEKDLKLRGPGEFLGDSQSGMPDVAMEALTDSRLIKSASSAAKDIFGKDPSLGGYPLLKSRLDKFEKEIHFE